MNHVEASIWYVSAFGSGEINILVIAPTNTHDGILVMAIL